MNKIFAIIVLLVFAIAHNASAMTWELKNDADNRFVVSFFPEKIADEKLRVNLIIRCDEKSLKTLSSAEQQLFSKSDDDQFVYLLFDPIDDYYSDEKSDEPISQDQRLVCEGEPQKMSFEELNSIIKTKKIIFYTGAGFSAQAIPTMNVLMQNLGMSKNLSKDNKLQEYISDVISNSEKYTEVLKDFFDRCENAPPTLAHTLLAKCAKKFNQLLLTENVDHLHQNSGIEPIVLASHDDKYRENEKIMKAIQEAEFIITIGLNSDESGFLKFYKTHNPKGKIISVNLTPTNYLSSDDFYVEGDIQKIAERIFAD